MNQTREITKLLNKSDLSPSLTYWCKLLDFFDTNKNSLTFEECCSIADESERCRLYWNTDRVEMITFSKNGKELTKKILYKGLDISQNGVYPNIHQFIDENFNTQLEQEYVVK